MDHSPTLYLNEFREDPSSLKCFVNGSTKPDRFLFAVNVGRSCKGDTFIGSVLQRGCHWTMCLVNINSREIIYGDSLGWPVPYGLTDKVYSFIKLNRSTQRDAFSVILYHDPHSVNSNSNPWLQLCMCTALSFSNMQQYLWYCCDGNVQQLLAITSHYFNWCPLHVSAKGIPINRHIFISRSLHNVMAIYMESLHPG